MSKPLDERIDYDSSVYEMESTVHAGSNILHVEIEFPIEVDKLTAIKQVDDLVALADNNNDIEITAWKPSIFEKGYDI